MRIRRTQSGQWRLNKQARQEKHGQRKQRQRSRQTRKNYETKWTWLWVQDPDSSILQLHFEECSWNLRFLLEVKSSEPPFFCIWTCFPKKEGWINLANIIIIIRLLLLYYFLSMVINKCKRTIYNLTLRLCAISFMVFSNSSSRDSLKSMCNFFISLTSSLSIISWYSSSVWDTNVWICIKTYL